MLKTLKKIAELILLGLIIINLSLAFYLSKALNCLSEEKTGSSLVLIEKGQSPRSIARTLTKNGLIRDPRAFHLAYSLYYAPQFLKAGEYEFSFPLSAKTTIREMIAGRVLLHPLTIPEGLTLKEIAQLLAEKHYPLQGSFLEAGHDSELISDLDPEATSLEGYLFPETYYFTREVKAEEIVKAMVAQFRANFGQKEIQRTKELRLKIREIVILASLIEKETSRAEEKPLVSAVFHNRLRLRMKLDSDPTIIYVLKNEERFDGNLKQEHKNLKSPYNTYLYPGLPPGPICNPGKDSLAAALYPAQVDYLYFVSRNDGSHVFNRSYPEHLKAVKKFQLKNSRVLR